MRKFRYVSPTGETVELDGDFAWTMTGAPIRGHSWDYELGYRDVSYISNPAREITLDCYVPRENADAMRTVFDRDVMAHQTDPEHWGTFWAGSSWSRGLVVAFEPTDIFPTFISASLKVVLVDPMWRDEGNTREFAAYSGHQASGGFDYSHDYEFDYGYERGQSKGSIANPSISEADFHLTVYGPAVNPEVWIGSNIYKVYANVTDGGRLEVDSVDKTVTLYSASSVATDAFQYAERGDGKGSGRYIFERIPRGTSRVSWNRAFTFRLTVYESSTEPRWA